MSDKTQIHLIMYLCNYMFFKIRVVETNSSTWRNQQAYETQQKFPFKYQWYNTFVEEEEEEEEEKEHTF